MLTNDRSSYAIPCSPDLSRRMMRDNQHSSRKSWKPSSAGCIDRGSQVAQVFGMKLKNTFSMWLKTLACFAFAFALVLSPPSASHAASGMHDDSHAVSVSFDGGDSNHVHDANSSISERATHASASDVDDNEQTSTQCCSGVCFSAVLNESGGDIVVQVTNGKYLPLHAQTASIEPSGFLRPPQFLI